MNTFRIMRALIRQNRRDETKRWAIRTDGIRRYKDYDNESYSFEFECPLTAFGNYQSNYRRYKNTLMMERVRDDFDIDQFTFNVFVVAADCTLERLYKNYKNEELNPRMRLINKKAMRLHMFMIRHLILNREISQ